MVHKFGLCQPLLERFLAPRIVCLDEVERAAQTDDFGVQFSDVVLQGSIALGRLTQVGFERGGTGGRGCLGEVEVV
jgi:hypothetical protein